MAAKRFVIFVLRAVFLDAALRLYDLITAGSSSVSVVKVV